MLVSMTPFCCFSSVHGDWTAWTEWTTCSKTCGAGTQTRERTCENPRPEHGGRPCEGPKEQARVCNARNCPGKFQTPTSEKRDMMNPANWNSQGKRLKFDMPRGAI